MKKLLIIGCALLLGSLAAYSEVIETVGYNPTRYGQYKRLKVTSGIELPKGLVSPNAVTQSGGSLVLEACQDGCTNPAYKIDYLKAAEIVQGNNTNFDVEKVTANRGTVTLNNGGEISSAIGAGTVAVEQLEATSSNLVVGSLLTLGKGVIGAPAGRTDCQWVWESITHKDGTAKVLALKGCAGGGTEPDPEPVNYCESRDYLLAHKEECCPSEPYSNGDCWKQECTYVWQTAVFHGISGTSGWANDGSCNTSLCKPNYAYGGEVKNYSSCISESNASSILSAVGIYRCTTSAGSYCSKGQEQLLCYVDYQFRTSGGAPCNYFAIDSSVLECVQNECHAVPNY